MIDGLPDEVRSLLRTEAVPDWRAPMLATLTERRFSDPRWVFELKLKFDGERCLAFRDGDRLRLLSRNRQSLNGTYPELVDALAAQRTSRFVVDGEVVTGVAFPRPLGGLPATRLAAAGAIAVWYPFGETNLGYQRRTHPVDTGLAVFDPGPQVGPQVMLPFPRSSSSTGLLRWYSSWRCAAEPRCFDDGEVEGLRPILVRLLRWR